MAPETGRAADRLTGALPRRLARLAPGLDWARARELARRLTRREWRRLRRLLGRRDLPVILQSMRIDQWQRARHAPQQPRPWTRPQALSALQSQRDRATLFGAIRLLQAASPESDRLGYAINPDREAVRIDQALVEGFVGREVADLAAGREDAPGAATRRWSGRPVLRQNALGLLGPNGPMPTAWTQHARSLPNSGSARPRQSFLGFMNLLQRRQLALLYRAWSDSQPITAMDAPSSPPHPLQARLAALAGLAHAGLGQRDRVAPSFKLAYATVLSRRVRNPEALAGMLRRYLCQAVRIQEFSCRWLEIPASEQTRLGVSHSRLGEKQGDTAVAGSRTWDCSTRFDIVVGPVDLDIYAALLPGQPLHEEVRDLVALYVGPEWEWQLQPVLKAGQVPVNHLGGQVARLGHTTWLGRRHGASDAGDLRMPMAPSLGKRPPEMNGAPRDGGRTLAMNDARMTLGLDIAPPLP